MVQPNGADANNLNVDDGVHHNNNIIDNNSENNIHDNNADIPIMLLIFLLTIILITVWLLVIIKEEQEEEIRANKKPIDVQEQQNQKKKEAKLESAERDDNKDLKGIGVDEGDGDEAYKEDGNRRRKGISIETLRRNRLWEHFMLLILKI